MERRKDVSAEFQKLQEAAKIASIFHKDQKKFHRNPNLEKLAYSSLHCLQLLTAMTILIFHHVYLAKNRRLHKKEPQVPLIPEEGSLFFLVHPICILISLVLMVLRIFTNILENKHEFVSNNDTGTVETIYQAVYPSIVGAILMISGGIAAMRHAKVHIDLDQVTDEELLQHPVYIHDFSVCIFSIFGMCLYLISFFLFCDVLQAESRRRKLEAAMDEVETSSSSSETLEGQDTRDQQEVEIDPEDEVGVEDRRERPGELRPIANLDAMPSHLTVEQGVEDDLAVYCCCVDLWNYLKKKNEPARPTHEFQVVHVM